MFKFILICIFTCPNAIYGETMLGKGIWSLISIEECPNHESLKETFKFDMNKHKLNRTHDALSGHVIITQDIKESDGLFIDVCKYVDGGCKQYQVASENISKFFNTYVRDNMILAFRLANLDIDDFPIPKGEYDLEDYLFDRCDLPPECPYGKYDALFYIVSNLEKVACMKLIVECTKCEDDEYCCDRDE